ncbi:MAG: PASTA domain-containing protein, partial [Oscillospiraceae bacterium]|nr:PASTA domain-containing protein [Oscillospiraceae bacterium]
TVYVIYEFIEGMTLTEFLKKNGGYLSWEDTKQLFMPLLSCINAIHTSEIIHRGISPDTILVDRSGNLKLTSFDIAPARTARSELVPQLYAGYAAPEQYTSSAWQGTFTDVYALAATIYRTLTGTMPVEAISRVSNDNLVSASALNPSIPKNVSNTLTAAMALSPEKRTETVTALISELSEVMDFGAAPAVEVEPEAEETVPAKKKLNDSTRYAIIAAGISAPVLIVIIILIMTFMFPSNNKPSKPSSSGSELSSTLTSSDDKDETSSDVRYLYSVPNFMTRNIDSVTNDTDYSQKYNFIIEYDYSEEYPEQIILKQSVEAGTPISEDGTEITLTVSRGSKYRTIPDLVGKDESYINATLDTLGIPRANYEFVTEVGNYGDPDTVISMSVEAGTVIDITQVYKITFYVYDEMPVSSENTSSEDTTWVDDLV